MPFRHLFYAICITLVAHVAAPGQSPLAPAASAPAASPGTSPPATGVELPVATRQNQFEIPFSLNLPSDPNQQPLEVQLYVSTDKGAKWQLYARQLPSATSFRFRATRDGDYWFAVRTVDRSGQLRPAGDPKPELRVVIDTAAPQLELAAEVGASGEVRVRWQAADSQLAVATFKLETQNSEKNWEAIAIELPADGASRTAWEQSASWLPRTSSRVVNLRAQVWDRAGNSTLVSKQVFLPRSAVPLASAPAKPPVSPTTPTVTNEGPADPFLPHRQPPATGTNAAALSPGVSPVPVPSAAAGPNAGNSLQNVSTPLTPSAGGDPVQPPTTPPPLPPPTPPPPPPSTEPMLPPPRESEAFVSDLLKLPPGERPRMTNRLRFNLDYEIDSVGPSGVAKVELFGTRDGGRSWQLLGVDPDKQSPFAVEVASEGVYGFKIVIESGNGLASKRPQSGDTADIWVGVDTTPPNCRLTSAQYGVGEQAGHLDLRWEAADANAAERPISLEFSAESAGPYTIIATGLPNSGQYLWRVDPRVPPKIFLRIRVRDAAGNEGTHQLAEAISVEGLAPKARIRGFLPTGETK